MGDVFSDGSMLILVIGEAEGTCSEDKGSCLGDKLMIEGS